MELNLLPHGLFMVWFNRFWKFEASVFFVGGRNGWVSEEEGQRLGWRNSDASNHKLHKQKCLSLGKMQLAGGAVCVWLLVSLGFHFPAPWKLICTCTKYTHRASCCMLVLSTSTEEVYVIAQGAKWRLGLRSRRCVSYLWGQQKSNYERERDTWALWHPSSLPGRPVGFYGHHLQQLLPPLQALPPGAAQMLVRSVWILS